MARVVQHVIFHRRIKLNHPPAVLRIEVRRIKRGNVPYTKFDRTYRLWTDLLLFFDLATPNHTVDRARQIRKLARAVALRDGFVACCFASPGELKPLHLAVSLMGRMIT